MRGEGVSCDDDRIRVERITERRDNLTEDPCAFVDDR